MFNQIVESILKTSTIDAIRASSAATCQLLNPEVRVPTQYRCHCRET
jgi:hypothetical protein